MNVMLEVGWFPPILYIFLMNKIGLGIGSSNIRLKSMLFLAIFIIAIGGYIIWNYDVNFITILKDNLGFFRLKYLIVKSIRLEWECEFELQILRLNYALYKKYNILLDLLYVEK